MVFKSFDRFLASDARRLTGWTAQDLAGEKQRAMSMPDAPGYSGPGASTEAVERPVEAQIHWRWQRHGRLHRCLGTRFRESRRPSKKNMKNMEKKMKTY